MKMLHMVQITLPVHEHIVLIFHKVSRMFVTVNGQLLRLSIIVSMELIALPFYLDTLLRFSFTLWRNEIADQQEGAWLWVGFAWFV